MVPHLAIQQLVSFVVFLIAADILQTFTTN